MLREWRTAEVGTSTMPLIKFDTETQTRPWTVTPKLDASVQTMEPFDQERLVYEWLKKRGLYMGESSVVKLSFWHHVMSCLKRPAGRADRAGSQQCAFSMDMPSMMPLRQDLAIARAASALARQLLKISNYKHKSWYVHMICFVVPQQIFRYGNTWRFLTAR